MNVTKSTMYTVDAEVFSRYGTAHGVVATRVHTHQ